MDCECRVLDVNRSAVASDGQGVVFYNLEQCCNDNDSASALIEGDIQIQLTPRSAPTSLDRKSCTTSTLDDEDQVVVQQPDSKWPNGTIPYVISDEIKNNAKYWNVHQNIFQAIVLWQQASPVLFTSRCRDSNGVMPSDFVQFVIAKGCSSSVGRISGMQTIKLSIDCTLGNVLHQIGHTLGLAHTNMRRDADQFVAVVEAKAATNKAPQFRRQIDFGGDILGYDYHSIMHYSPRAFSAALDAPSMEALGGQLIGQRDHLSLGDAAAAIWLYGSQITPLPGLSATTLAPGLTVVCGQLTCGNIFVETWTGKELKRTGERYELFHQINLRSPPTMVDWSPAVGSGDFFAVSGSASKTVLRIFKTAVGLWSTSKETRHSFAFVGPLAVSARDRMGRAVLFGATALGSVVKIEGGAAVDIGAPPGAFGPLLGTPIAAARRPKGSDRHDVFLVGQHGRLIHLCVRDQATVASPAKGRRSVDTVRQGLGASVTWTDLGCPHSTFDLCSPLSYIGAVSCSEDRVDVLGVVQKEATNLVSSTKITQAISKAHLLQVTLDLAHSTVVCELHDNVPSGIRGPWIAVAHVDHATYRFFATGKHDTVVSWLLSVDRRAGSANRVFRK